MQHMQHSNTFPHKANRGVEKLREEMKQSKMSEQLQLYSQLSLIAVMQVSYRS